MKRDRLSPLERVGEEQPGNPGADDRYRNRIAADLFANLLTCQAQECGPGVRPDDLVNDFTWRDVVAQFIDQLGDIGAVLLRSFGELVGAFAHEACTC